jgi:multiple sugar transport system permease protein
MPDSILSTAVPGASAPTRAVRLFRSETIAGWLFIAPALLGFSIFYLLPTLRAFYIGLTNWNLLRAPKFIGLENYQRLLGDDRFWNALWTTVLYVLYNIPLQTVVGLLLAVLLDRLTRSVAIRSLLLAPFLISNVIAAMIWFWLLDPILGFGNVLLQALGLGRHAFFSDQHLALVAIAMINTWRHVGFVTLLFYTGLQSIPPHLYEAARIEGATGWRSFRSITLPLLRPTLVFVLVTSVIGSFQIFDTIAVTTQGGPGSATRTIVWYIYETAFNNLRMGYASAMSCALFLGLILVTLVQMRAFRSSQSDLS